MKFEKGQWYSDGERFYQYHDIGYSNNILYFRMAGNNIPLPYGQPEKLTPASITPDFSNAKEGDECWGYDFNNQSITFISEDTVQVKYESKSGFDQTAIFWKNGKIYGFRTHDANGLHYLDWESAHPSLFNSFAQFQAYWAEEFLKMKGGSDA